LKKIEGKKMKKDRNALFDVKMNKNSDVKIFGGGGTSIPESRVSE
jgi:hypothetical protein